MLRRAQSLYQPLHRGGETRFTNGLHEIVKRFSLEGPNGELIEGGEKHHCWHSFSSAAPDHFKAIYARHLNIEKDHVRCGHIQSCEHLRAIAAFAGNGELRKCHQQLPHAPASRRFVVCDQYSPLTLFHHSTPVATRNTATLA